MAGYSATPLIKKLGLQSGMKLYLVNAPADYYEWIAPVPENINIVSRMTAGLDMVHVFSTDAAQLMKVLQQTRNRLKPDGMIWVSWPKKAAKMATDITEDTIRTIALPMGLVDIKVCAVTEVWSGLKLVIRKELRGK